jgi:hypothetical protein
MKADELDREEGWPATVGEIAIDPAEDLVGPFDIAEAAIAFGYEDGDMFHVSILFFFHPDDGIVGAEFIFFPQRVGGVFDPVAVYDELVEMLADGQMYVAEPGIPFACHPQGIGAPIVELAGQVDGSGVGVAFQTESIIGLDDQKGIGYMVRLVIDEKGIGGVFDPFTVYHKAILIIAGA